MMCKLTSGPLRWFQILSDESSLLRFYYNLFFTFSDRLSHTHAIAESEIVSLSANLQAHYLNPFLSSWMNVEGLVGFWSPRFERN
jgi:hypothetical protein